MPFWRRNKTNGQLDHPLLELTRRSDDQANEDGDQESQSALEEEQEEGCLRRHCSLYMGLAFSSTSSLFFSLCSVIVKYLQDIHPGELAFFRFVGILIFTLPIVIYSRAHPFGPKDMRHLLVLRGLVGATSLFLRFCAMHYLPIADASVIIFSVPVFVTLFANIFLKEPCGIFHIVLVTLTMTGLLLITKFPFLSGSQVMSQEHLWGVLAGLGSTFFGACVYIVIRKAKGVHHSVIMFNFGWVAIIETSVITFLLGGFSLPKCGCEQWLIVFLGTFSFLGQILLTKALQLEQAGPVSVVRAAADIAFAFIWQIVFFKDIPDVYSITGALLVTSCVMLTGVRKWVISLPEHSLMKRKLYILTL